MAFSATPSRCHWTSLYRRCLGIGNVISAVTLVDINSGDTLYIIEHIKCQNICKDCIMYLIYIIILLLLNVVIFTYNNSLLLRSCPK